MGIISSTVDIIIILLGFGLLIFVHEMGHFLAAKWAGIRTEAFAVGMGPVVVSWRKGIGFAVGSTDRRVVARAGRHAYELSGRRKASIAFAAIPCANALGCWLLGCTQSSGPS